MSLSIPHALAVWRRNASLYPRIWKTTLLPNFFEPVFFLTAIGIGVGAYITEMAGVPYIEFLAPGLMCVSAMNGASFEVTFNVFIRMVYEKTYDGVLTTPVNTDDILVGEVLWGLTRSFLYGGGFYVVAILFGLVELPIGLLAILVVPLAGLLFASIGIAFTPQDANYRFVQLLFHAVPNADVPFCRRVFPDRGTFSRLVAAGRRSAAPAASGASVAHGVQWRVVLDRVVGRRLHPGDLDRSIGVGETECPQTPDELEAQDRRGSRSSRSEVG